MSYFFVILILIIFTMFVVCKSKTTNKYLIKSIPDNILNRYEIGILLEKKNLKVQLK